MRMRGFVLGALLLAATPVRADVTLGAVLSLTGPGAGLGIPERNTIELLPKTMAGQAVHWVVLDDASDPALAVRAARKLIEEAHVDAILGPSTTANSLALLDPLAEAGVPFVSLSGSGSVVTPPGGTRAWAFKLIPSERVATVQIVDHMQARGFKRLGQIGFANALGDGYVAALSAQAAERGIETVIDVRYSPTDTSVTPQVLRLLQARPDAVFVAASASPATTPILELRKRGYAGPIYTVQGIAGPDALRVGGAALDGVVFSSVPVLVAEQIASDNPVRPQAMAYVTAYEERFGAGSRSLFGATMWDGFLLIAEAAAPALAAGPPGTPAFRAALRDAMERTHGLAGCEAVFSLSSQDHSGAEADSQVLVEIRDGSYRLAQ